MSVAQALFAFLCTVVVALLVCNMLSRLWAYAPTKIQTGYVDADAPSAICTGLALDQSSARRGPLSWFGCEERLPRWGRTWHVGFLPVWVIGLSNDRFQLQFCLLFTETSREWQRWLCHRAQLSGAMELQYYCPLKCRCLKDAITLWTWSQRCQDATIARPLDQVPWTGFMGMRWAIWDMASLASWW